MLYWTTTFGGTVFLLDPQSFALRKKVSVQTTNDSGGVYLDGLYYFGTVNTPEDNCQNPINENCGAVFAIDAQGNEENRPQRPAAWGFVTHVHEFMVGNQGENPPDPATLALFDEFWSYVAQQAAAGRVVFATAGEIAEAAFPGAVP